MSSPPPGCEPLRAPAPYLLWRIDLNTPWPAESDSVLSSQEQARAQRFAFDRHRRRYRAAHLAMRHLLAARSGAGAHELQYKIGPFGKPRLAAPHAALGFNLSDSDDLALLAMATHEEIGVDVEMLRAVPDASELAELHFTPSERVELAATPAGPARDRRFLVGWTRKEACLKAIGSGLSIGAHTFEAGLDEALRPIGIATGAATAWVEVMSLPAGPACVAALARCIERVAR